tara:strand:+ start:702 stop:875 length:174 start_codon:yes stop_codon:yes gene_type:complete
MWHKSIMTLSCINMAFALYAGFYIPHEHHSSFALTIRDYFLISAVAFAIALHGTLKK